MFEDPYKNIPRDEIEAKALKELMGYNIELPKARLLHILREEGGDVDCASARAFIEMRDQYKAQRGEPISTKENNNNYNNSTSNNNNKNQHNGGGGASNYYDSTYQERTAYNENAHNLNAFHNEPNEYGYDDDDNDGFNNNDRAGGSYDMTFDAKVTFHQNQNDDDQQQQPKHHKQQDGTFAANNNNNYYFEDGSYMLRVRSKDYNSSNELQFQHDRGMEARVESYGQHPAEDDDDSDREDEKNQSKQQPAPAKKFPGVFMKTFGWGGFVANKSSYSAADGSFLSPYSFVNDGIRIIRLDSEHDTHTHSVNVVDTSNLEDDEFEALCDDWLDETYDTTEVPDMFHEGADYQTAKAKNDHDFKMFELYSEFEKSLRGRFSLSAALSVFVDQQQKAHRIYRKTLGLPLLPGMAGYTDEEEDALKTKAKPVAKVKTTGTSRNPYKQTEAYSGQVTRNVASLNREFSLSIRLPRTCTVTRVELIRNTMLEKRFDKYCDSLRKHGIPYNIGTGYHGTAESVVKLIAQTGFICPLEGNKGVTHKSGNNGFYGNGNYQSPDPNVAYWYSQGSMMLISKCARGRVYRCPGMMLGADCESGYDSHEDPSGVEWVFYTAAAVLPVAIIHFSREYSSHGSVTTVTKATIKGRAIADYRGELDRKGHGGVHLSNKDRKAVNRARNAQIQDAKKKK